MAVGNATDARGHGNHAILTKVDKLRELVGSRVPLPQLVVAGDQSSGKSSVLTGLTGFAFPRAAELCTRYATQITCRREAQEEITVSIIPSADANASEQERVKRFRHTLTKITPKSLAEIFGKANEALGIRTSSKATSSDGRSLPAFSQHVLKIEKVGPKEEHFTVIDVPGIFRRETEGLTQESDIELVRNMVKRYMKDSRTIILAIMPCNVDPATQEILKLAKEADPTMTRTMAVLTKADLAQEQITKQIAIEHVLGKKNYINLGYYIVRNRGSDESEQSMTLDQALARERQFFSEAPWSALSHTGRAGMDNLKVRVQDLLIALIKREFPYLRSEINKEAKTLGETRDKMGPARGDEHSQRAYLSKICDKFQSLARDALSASYTSEKLFVHRHDLRLITRIVDISEKFDKCMERVGHTWPFETEPNSAENNRSNSPDAGKTLGDFLGLDETRERLGSLKSSKANFKVAPANHPELDDFLDLNKTRERLGSLKSSKANFEVAPVKYPELDDFDLEADIVDSAEGSIMDYIEDVYNSSRGQDLGTFGPMLVAAVFKEQSTKWEPITLAYVGHVIIMVHHFIAEAVKEICPDPKVREQLWDNVLLEELQKSYARSMNNAKFLLEIEREGKPLTLNHYFNDNIQKTQNSRFVASLRKLSGSSKLEDDKTVPSAGGEEKPRGIFLPFSQLENMTTFNKANSEQVREELHDVLKSYYKVSRKRFVDVVYQQAINYFLLRGRDSPLEIFTIDMVSKLSADQLDMIAGEDAPVKECREKLDREIENYQKALKVLKG